MKSTNPNKDDQEPPNLGSNQFGDETLADNEQSITHEDQIRTAGLPENFNLSAFSDSDHNSRILPAYRQSPAGNPPTNNNFSEEQHREFPSPDKIPMEWEIGDRLLNTYEVVGILGQGGMGKVYKIHHLNWNMDLAVKSPHPHFFTSNAQKNNLIREANVWVSLGLHPNIVNCFYVRTLGGIPRIYSEYVAGGSLFDWIRTRKLYQGETRQISELILDISIQIAWGLQYAHEQEGMVHRDIKPTNIMLTRDGIAKVTDFGGGVTPAYCSPEQALGKTLTNQSDMWNWAATVLEMCMQERSWMVGQAAGLALENYLNMEWKNSKKLLVSEGIIDLLRQCLRNEPDTRPATMQNIAQVLQEIYRDEFGVNYARQIPRAADLRADSLNNQAVSQWEIGEKTSGIEKWKNALQIDPLHIPARVNLAYYEWGNATLAIHDVRPDLHRLVPVGSTQPFEYHVWLAQLDYSWGYYTDALERLEKLIDSPKFRSIEWNLYGSLLQETGQFGSAEIAFARAFEMDPNDPIIRTNLEECRLLQNVGPDSELQDEFDPEQTGSLVKNGSASSQLNDKADLTVILNKDKKGFLIRDESRGLIKHLASNHLTGVQCYTLSERRRQVVSAAADRAVFLYDIDSTRVVSAYYELESDPRAMGFARGDSLLWVLTFSDALYILDVENNLHLNRKLLTNDSINDINVWVTTDPDEGRLLALYNQNWLHIWDTTTFQELCCFEAPRELEDGAFTKGCAKILASGQEIETHCSLSKLMGLQHGPQVRIQPAIVRPKDAVEETDEGRKFKSLIRDAEKMIEQRHVQAAHDRLREVQDISGYSRDVRIVDLLNSLDQIGAYRLGLQSSWLAAEIAINLEGDLCLAVTPDGSQLVASSRQQNGGVVLVDLNASILLPINKPKDETSSITIDTQKKYFAAGGRSGELFLHGLGENQWVLNKESVRSFYVTLGEKGAIKRLCNSADGLHLAAGHGVDVTVLSVRSIESKLYVFDVKTLEGCGELIQLLNFSPSGRFLLAITGQIKQFWEEGNEVDTIMLWDCADFRFKWIRRYPLGRLQAAVWDAEEKQIMAISQEDGSVSSISVETGKVASVFQTGSRCAGLAITSDSKFMIIANADGHLGVWDLDKGVCTQEINTVRGRIKDLQMALDTQGVFIAHENGNLSRWNFDWSWHIPHQQ